MNFLDFIRKFYSVKIKINLLNKWSISKISYYYKSSILEGGLEGERGVRNARLKGSNKKRTKRKGVLRNKITILYETQLGDIQKEYSLKY